MLNYDHLTKWHEVEVQERISHLSDFQRRIFDETKAMGCSVRYALFLAITWPDNYDMPKGEK